MYRGFTGAYIRKDLWSEKRRDSYKVDVRKFGEYWSSFRLKKLITVTMNIHAFKEAGVVELNTSKQAMDLHTVLKVLKS